MTFVYVVLLVICFVIFQYRMRRERSLRGLRKYFRDYIILAFFLGLTASFFYLRRVRLSSLVTPPVIESLQELEQLPVGTPIRLYGNVSTQMTTQLDGYVAYIQESTLTANVVATPQLLIETRDSPILVNNSNYGEWGWDKDQTEEADIFHIEPSDQVIVYAYVDDLTDELAEVNADFVYLGSVAEFDAMVARMMLGPTILAIMATLTTIGALVLPFGYYIQYRRKLSAVECR